MKKKFITICLFLITLFAVVSSILFFTHNEQPVFYAQEQILFPAPSLPTLAPQTITEQLLSAILPYGVVCLLVVTLFIYAKKHFKTLKKHFPKIVCTVLCVLCLGTCVTITSSVADSSFTPVSPSNYYGRKQLEKLSNSDALLFAYDQMVDGIENYADKIVIKNTFYSINKNEWDVVLYSYLYDYPQHFWMDFSYQYSYENTINGEIIMTSIHPNYVFSAVELPTARDTFNKKAQEILNTLSPSMSEYELELAIHNKLCEINVYQNGEHAHSAYGGLVDGVSVCEGYAKAFQYLLNQVGIESTLATGVGMPANATEPENHAWNLVKINGKYYYVDVTWDDQTQEPYYAYFNITTAMLNEDHALANYPHTLPECTSLDDNYFKINQGFISSYNLDQIVSCLQYNLKTHVYITGATNPFNNNLLNDSQNIIKALNMVTSSNIAISSLGRERVITINGHRRGDVNGDKILDTKDIDLLNQYFNNPSAITDATCLKAADYNNDGKIDSKDSSALTSFINGTPVEPEPSTPSSNTSSAPIVSSAPVASSQPTSSDNTSSSSVITSNPSEITSTPSTPSSSGSDNPSTSLPLGDVNDDTVVNAKDALIVLRISVGKYTANEEEQKAADVNKDNIVNAKDALEILKKSVGKPACF